MTATYRVETDSVDGMHRVVAVGRMPDDVPGQVEELAEDELAIVRSAVRGRLDLIGHEAGPAVTVVALHGPRPEILSCRTDRA